MDGTTVCTTSSHALESGWRGVQNLDLHQMDCPGLGWPSVEVIEGHQCRPTRSFCLCHYWEGPASTPIDSIAFPSHGSDRARPMAAIPLFPPRYCPSILVARRDLCCLLVRCASANSTGPSAAKKESRPLEFACGSIQRVHICAAITEYCDIAAHRGSKNYRAPHKTRGPKRPKHATRFRIE